MSERSGTGEQSGIQIGVVGAGTMGQGIAQVALTAGYQVILCDAFAEVLGRAEASIVRHLQRSVDKSRMTAKEMDESISRLSFSTDFNQLAGARLVIEAVPESLELKRKVFLQLENVCAEDAILASNTSSLSITVLGAGLAHKERMIGLHFFNPAPVMRLIEIVVGDDTDPAVVSSATQFARSLGKETIVCRDTPGFVVNRVARNFYGEALRIVGEGSADFATVDGLLERGAGFRMGPFALMDLIGIDVNFDVTNSVYQAFHQEARFRPHLLQEKKVLAGQLGKKSRQGFYTYTEDGRRAENDATLALLESSLRPDGAVSDKEAVPKVVVVGDTPLAHALALHVTQIDGFEDRSMLFHGPPKESDPTDAVHRIDGIQAHMEVHKPDVVIVSVAGDSAFHRDLLQAVTLCVASTTLVLSDIVGPSASRQASWLPDSARLCGFSLVPSEATVNALTRHLESDSELSFDSRPETVFTNGQFVEWSRPVQAETQSDDRSKEATEVFLHLGLSPVEIRDGPGGIAGRILAMILNEALEVMYERTASETDIDTAMKLGTNYPVGPFDWLRAIGPASVWYTLHTLLTETGDPRYRISQGLITKFLQST